LHFAAVDVCEATAGRRRCALVSRPRTLSAVGLQNSKRLSRCLDICGRGFRRGQETFTEREPTQNRSGSGFNAKPQAAAACGLAVLG